MKDISQHTMKSMYFPLVHISTLQIIFHNTDISYYNTTFFTKTF